MGGIYMVDDVVDRHVMTNLTNNMMVHAALIYCSQFLDTRSKSYSNGANNKKSVTLLCPGTDIGNSHRTSCRRMSLRI